jgi:hypothetical protein
VVVRVDGPIDRYDEQGLRNRITLIEAFPTFDEAEGGSSSVVFSPLRTFSSSD